jgi:PAS domain S-box-containing protein
LFEALNNSADGAFVIDEDLRVVYCNQAAEVILGFDHKEIVGQFCYQLLRGYDHGRQLVCKAHCQVAKMTLNAKSVPNYDIQIKTNYGVRCWVNMSVFAYRMGDKKGEKGVVHLFHDLKQKNMNEKLLTDLVGMLDRIQDILPKNGNGAEPLPEALTPRENEVLMLLVEGHGTRDIANHLSISLNTVRNHIQNILQKFQVHSRLEAVALALKHDLIG